MLPTCLSTLKPCTNTLALAAALSIVSLALGYRLGTRSAGQHPPSIKSDNKEDNNDYGNDSEEEEEVADGDLSAIQAGFLEPCKLVC